ncbi:MAG: hypothetical protein K1W18_07055 [Oscillospiraceae bacterium]
MDEITLETLCGVHIFSANEYTTEDGCEVGLFELDGVTYRAEQDPDDGYRNHCKSLKISNRKPTNSFDGVKVLCHMAEDTYYDKNDFLVVRDLLNGKIILEVGTKNINDYPRYVFNYYPESMACNQKGC